MLLKESIVTLLFVPTVTCFEQCPYESSHTLSRREILKKSAGTVASLTSAPVAASPPAESIYDTKTGTFLQPGPLSALLPKEVLDMPKGGVIVVGENHGSPLHHRLQLDIIKTLHAESIKKPGRPPLAIGLEMFFRQQQPLLDRFVFSDQLVERYNSSYEYGIQDLERDAKWRETWGWDINGGYSKIFAFAKKNGIRLVGLNCPTQVVELVRESGISDIDPDISALLPPRMDFGNERHRKRFEDTMAEMESIGVSHMNLRGATAYEVDMSKVSAQTEDREQILQKYYESQTLWDEYCAESAAKYYESCAQTEEKRGSGFEGAKLIILAGSSHIWGRNGIPDRIVHRLKQDYSRDLPFPPFTIVAQGVRWTSAGTPQTLEKPTVEDSDWIWYTQIDSKPPPGYQQGIQGK